MAFEKNNWKSGDVISSTKLNKMEDGIVEASEPVAWENVTDKPTTFEPSTHSHDWADVTGKPDTFPPAIGKTETTAKAGNYVPTWAEIKGKPETFTPETHSHDWGEIADKPTTFTPTIGKTATTAKAGDYVPTWGEITGKPSTFTPGTHNHAIANVTGLQEKLGQLDDNYSTLETLLDETLDSLNSLASRVEALEKSAEEPTDPVEDGGTE